MQIRPKSVAFSAVAKEMPLVLGLAEQMKSAFGARVYLYVSSLSEKRGLERTGVAKKFDAVEVEGTVGQFIEDQVTDEAAVIDQARAWEVRTGETILQSLLEVRQLSRGFLPGGCGFPRAPAYWNASYVSIVNAAVKAFEFWSREIEEKEIDLAINIRNPCVAVCRAKGVAYRRIYPSKFGGEHYWAIDEKGTHPRIPAIYDSLTPADCPAVVLHGTHHSQASKVRDAERAYSFLAPLRYFGQQVPRTILARLRGQRRGNLFLGDVLKVGFRTPRNTALYKRLVNTTLEQLEGTPFIYFPLHKEPETDMLARCPEYTNQVTAIASLARVAPVGVRIVVKEHIPAYPYRTPQFYYGLRDFKNISFVDSWESSFDLIRASTVTATITGGAGLEGAVVGKPVIQFNRHAIYRFLPHVLTVEREEDIGTFLRQALQGEIDLEQAQMDGRRFRETLQRVGFDAPDFAVNYREPMAETSIEAALTNLLDGMQSDPAEQVTDIPKAGIAG